MPGPGDAILHSQPLYGGTETLLRAACAGIRHRRRRLLRRHRAEAIEAAATRAMDRGRVSLMMVETPSNPLNTLVDLRAIRAMADGSASRRATAR